jgi:hypothetical protein
MAMSVFAGGNIAGSSMHVVAVGFLACVEVADHLMIHPGRRWIHQKQFFYARGLLRCMASGVRVAYVVDVVDVVDVSNISRIAS